MTPDCRHYSLRGQLCFVLQLHFPSSFVLVSFSSLSLFVYFLSVISLDNGFHVWHATVWDFDGISCIFYGGGRFLGNNCRRSVRIFGLYWFSWFYHRVGFTSIPLSVSSWFLSSLFIYKVVILSAIIQCPLIYGFMLLMRIFPTGAG